MNLFEKVINWVAYVLLMSWKSLLGKIFYFSSHFDSTNEMSSTIQQVLQCALKTFTSTNGNHAIKDATEFQRLAKLCKILQSEDLNFHQERFEPIYEFRQVTGGYVDLVHTSQLSMGVFSIKANGIIPLHDHRHMHGLIKVLSGALEIQSYTPISSSSLQPSDSILQKLSSGSNNVSKLICALVHEPLMLTHADPEVAILTPTDKNLHQIRSVSDGAAFLDILSPPYHSERDCHYFRILGTQFEDQLDSDIAWLMPLDQAPTDFSTISLPYQGPKLSLKS